MENITIFIICCLLSCCIILSVVGGILLTKPKPKPKSKKKQEETEKEETEKEETTQQPSTQTTTQTTQQPSTQTTKQPSTQTTTQPPAPPSNYFLHGPWIDYNTSFRKVGKINKVGQENVYLVEDVGMTKMVSESGVGKYYEGKIQDFDSSKWDTYNKVPEKSYILRVCPANCTNGCSGDNNKVCSSSP